MALMMRKSEEQARPRSFESAYGRKRGLVIYDPVEQMVFVRGLVSGMFRQADDQLQELALQEGPDAVAAIARKFYDGWLGQQVVPSNLIA